MFQILIILALIVSLSLLVPVVCKSGSKKKIMRELWAVFAIYLVGNLYCTTLSRDLGSGGRIRLYPFATYNNLFRNSGRSEKAAGLFAWFMQGSAPIVALVLNILLYYPLGYLLPVLFPKLKARYVILIGFLCSVVTEVIQYLFKLGWCETDDVVHNTLGTAIGVLVWCLQSKRFRGKINSEN